MSLLRVFCFRPINLATKYLVSFANVRASFAFVALNFNCAGDRITFGKNMYLSNFIEDWSLTKKDSSLTQTDSSLTQTDSSLT
jgi:hypothetical protein